MTYTLDDIKEKVTPIARKYGVDSVSVFGSYARGNANANSDVDLYIDKGNVKSLIQYFSLVNELEEVLNCHVDVVTTDIRDREFLVSIQKEGIVVYGGK